MLGVLSWWALNGVCDINYSWVVTLCDYLLEGASKVIYYSWYPNIFSPLMYWCSLTASLQLTLLFLVKAREGACSLIKKNFFLLIFFLSSPDQAYVDTMLLFFFLPVAHRSRNT